MHGGDIYRNQVELDFSVNMNPLGIPEGVCQAMKEAVGLCDCYPDIRHEELTQAICRMTGAEASDILCGNGASELFLAVIHGVRPKQVVIPVPSFFGYEHAAVAGGGRIFYYEMKKEDGFCLSEDILGFLGEETDLLFLANPNNPVGNCISMSLLEQVVSHCERHGIVVLLDECFIEFTENWRQAAFLEKTRQYKNLIVVRAFTKIFSIPGVRLGYLVCGNESLREAVKKQLPEWNLSIFAQKAGVAAAKEEGYLEKTAAEVKKEREFLEQGLKELGFTVFPASANYLMVFTEYPLAYRLLKEKILIRDCSDYRGLVSGYYRIAVKNRKDNETLLQKIGALKWD